MAERAEHHHDQPSETDEEIRARMMADPEKRSRAEQLAKEVRNGTADTDGGVGVTDLPDFLRDHGL
jgi:hypothetical protein